jgi:hypothetical protein
MIDADKKVLRLHTSTPLSWRDYFVGIVTTPAHVGRHPATQTNKDALLIAAY